VSIDDALDRIEDLDARGEDEELREAVAEGLAAFPDAPELREWEAALLVDDDRFADALAVLDRVLAAHPERFWARRERAAVLIDLGRFAEALDALRALPAAECRRASRPERAAIHADLGVCFDRLGRAAEADAEFRAAAKLDRRNHAIPLRLADERFEALVAQALDTIPEDFTPYLDQVVVRVRDYPAPDDADPFLLGLYVGVSRRERTLATEDHLDHILVFKRAHELRASDEATLREEIRRTVVHEIAHHFGLEHEDMGDYR
jgi:predicted Zn-dependent protease with MMP-like domain